MNDNLIKRMDELIRRRDAIEAIRRERNINALMDIPAVEPKRGEWIEVDDYFIRCKCSICGWESHKYEDDVYGMPYCPNCGAKMKGADDEYD